MCVGVPLRSDHYVLAKMEEKLTELQEEVSRASSLLGKEKHSLWTVLRSSTLHKLDYWLGLVHLTVMQASAYKMDKLLEDMLGTVIGLDLNQIEGLKLDPGIEGLRGHSFQWWVSQLPIKAGGLGLRNQTYLSNIAYLGTIELCLPSFTGPQLQAWTPTIRPY